MEEAVSDEEENLKKEDSQGSFLFGSGFVLLSGLLVMAITLKGIKIYTQNLTSIKPN